jgi:hypothetical protein
METRREMDERKLVGLALGVDGETGEEGEDAGMEREMQDAFKYQPRRGSNRNSVPWLHQYC